IIHATDGLKAIDLCKNNPQIDIVLMDIQLPKLNGLEATKEILKFRPNLPIISQTANAMREDENMAFEAGCVDYVSKPISEETLLEIINKNLRTNR
ncbi:MAG: response regulator, partial [Bacteroidales bacterium]|nr:response regulator [Bacteroidales bacterium]